MRIMSASGASVILGHLNGLVTHSRAEQVHDERHVKFRHRCLSQGASSSICEDLRRPAWRYLARIRVKGGGLRYSCHFDIWHQWLSIVNEPDTSRLRGLS